MQQIEFKEISNPEAKKNLVERLSVKEEGKLHESPLKQNICALDMMGLSWLFQEDDLC